MDSLTCHKYDIWESSSSDCWERCSEKDNLISDYHIKYLFSTFGVGLQNQVWKGWHHGWIDKKEVAIAQAYNYWERRLAKSWRKLCTGCQMRKSRGKTQKSWIWTEYSQLKLISDQVGPKRQHRTVPDQLSEHCRGFMCCMAWQG